MKITVPCTKLTTHYDYTDYRQLSNDYSIQYDIVTWWIDFGWFHCDKYRQFLGPGNVGAGTDWSWSSAGVTGSIQFQYYHRGYDMASPVVIMMCGLCTNTGWRCGFDLEWSILLLYIVKSNVYRSSKWRCLAGHAIWQSNWWIQPKLINA